MNRFIPITDSITDRKSPPGLKLIPYRVGLPCLHWEIVSDRKAAEKIVVSGAEQPVISTD